MLAAHLLALTPLVIWGVPHIETHDVPVEVDRLMPTATATIAALIGRESYRSVLTAKLLAVLDPSGVVARYLTAKNS